MYKYLVLFCVGFGMGSQLQAQNLLANGSFDINIDGWSNTFVTLNWVSDDGAPWSGNGSLQFGTDFNNNGSFFVESESIPVNANDMYIFAGTFKIPSDSPAAFARIEIHWFDGVDTEISDDDIWSVFLPTQDVWTDLSNQAIAPVGAVNAVYKLFFQSGEPGEPADPYGRWDDLIFVNDTIFKNDFE